MNSSSAKSADSDIWGHVVMEEERKELGDDDEEEVGKGGNKYIVPSYKVVVVEIVNGPGKKIRGADDTPAVHILLFIPLT